MDNSNKIVPPHLNAEIYRTDTTGTSTQSYLDYIHFHEDGSVLIGCSELTGRYWNGGASVFEIHNDKNNSNISKKDIYLTNGTADGSFIENSSKVILCEDSGTVSIWSTKPDETWKLWIEEQSAAEHDEAVLGIDCLVPNKEYVTVGADGNIKVWDTIDLICIRNYIAAHSKSIYGVSVRPSCTSSFITGSSDRCIYLWDQNTAKAALDVTESDCGIRCLQWLNENHIIFGDEAGIISLIDIRKPLNSVKLAEFPAAVHKISIAHQSNLVSVCCDNKTVSVFGISDDYKLNLTYENSDLHNNYVRGMAWDNENKNILYTVGWDGEMKKHIL